MFLNVASTLERLRPVSVEDLGARHFSCAFERRSVNIFTEDRNINDTLTRENSLIIIIRVMPNLAKLETSSYFWNSRSLPEI